MKNYKSTVTINGKEVPTYGVGILPHHLLSPKGKVFKAMVKGVILDTWMANALTDGVCGGRYIRFIREDGHEVNCTWEEGKDRSGFHKGHQHKNYTMPEGYRKALYTAIFGG